MIELKCNFTKVWTTLKSSKSDYFKFIAKVILMMIMMVSIVRFHHSFTGLDHFVELGHQIQTACRLATHAGKW